MLLVQNMPRALPNKSPHGNTMLAGGHLIEIYLLEVLNYPCSRLRRLAMQML